MQPRDMVTAFAGFHPDHSGPGRGLALKISKHRRRWTATLLLLVAGHLGSLAGFQLACLWDFAPLEFHPFRALLLFWSFHQLTSIGLVRPDGATATGLNLVAWCASVCFPLLYGPLEIIGVYLGLALLLQACALRGAERLLGLLFTLTTALVLTALFPWRFWVGPVLLAANLTELKFVRGRLREQDELARLKDHSAHSYPRAEISWKGFARLYAVAARGEGEKFSGKVLRDTVQVIERYQGVRLSGSEHRGVYQFPSLDDRERCYASLKQYEGQTVEVLRSVQAPSVELVFQRQ